MTPESGLALGVVAVVLMLVTGAQTLPLRFAWLPAFVFATTPLVVFAIREQQPLLRMLPFPIIWLTAMLVPGPRLITWRAVVAGAALGFGLYAHPSGVITMPLLLAVALIAMRHGGRWQSAAAGAMVVTFVAIAMPLAFMYVSSPQTFNAQVMRYGLYDAARFNLLQGAREMASWVGLTVRAEVFYDYFNPGFWFLRGGTIRSAILKPEVFLLPLAVLVPAGMHRLVSQRLHGDAWLLLGGLVVAPLPAALTAQPPTPARLLLATPFVAWIAAHGVIHLLGAARAAGWTPLARR